MSGLEVTDIQVRKGSPSSGSVLAIGSIVVNDALRVRGIRVIEGPRGPIVTFPDREKHNPCPHGRCRESNKVTARFCNRCGGKLPEGPYMTARERFHSIVKPTNEPSRRLLSDPVLDAWESLTGADLEDD